MAVSAAPSVRAADPARSLRWLMWGVPAFLFFLAFVHRVAPGVMAKDLMQAFGATAVPMGLAEMITSLQSGVIDGTMSGISIYVNFNLQSVSKTITETNDTLLVSFGSMSKKWLDTLPADLRKTVVDQARGLQDFAIKQSDDEKVALRAKWIERGGEIINLPPEDMVELKKRLMSIGAEITKTDPTLKAFYDKVLATAAKY